MKNNKGEKNENMYSNKVTLHDANKAKEVQVVLDPEKGPENKPRKQ